jgi:hypothetical protein
MAYDATPIARNSTSPEWASRRYSSVPVPRYRNSYARRAASTASQITGTSAE